MSVFERGNEQQNTNNVPDITIETNERVIVSPNTGFRILSVVIKLLIAIFSIGFIYHEIVYNKDLTAIQLFLTNMFQNTLDFVLLFTVLLMMLANWTLESAKWRYLITKIENISLGKSLRAIFSGTSVSVFTPNRVGDFGARVLFLDHSDRIKAVFITILGSISQLVITIIIGILGISALAMSEYSGLLDPVLSYLVFGVLALSAVLTLVSYYNISVFTSWGKKLFKILGPSWNKRVRKRLKGYAQVFSLYSPRELSITLLLSFIRYCVFSIQFYVLLILFGVDIPLLHAFALISLIFFSMAVIPTVALTEIGVRGSVALFFLGLASENSIGIVTATFGLWIINLALPAIIGSFFVFGTNIFGLSKK